MLIAQIMVNNMKSEEAREEGLTRRRECTCDRLGKETSVEKMQDFLNAN